MKIINAYTTRYGYLETKKVLAWNKAWKFCIPLGLYKNTGFKTFEEYQEMGSFSEDK